MAKRTPADVYRALIGAGFSRQSATIEDAIAGAESGWNDTAQGDLGLQDGTWGPSYGLFQIRTEKSATGTGGDRDIAWLAASDANQAKAAYDISNHGANFGPWTTFTSGKYQQFMSQAQAAAGAGGGSVVPTAADFNLPGPDWLWGWLPNAGAHALDSASGQALAGARNIAVEAVFVVLGLGLVYAGVVAAVRPRTTAKTTQARQLAATVVP